MTSTVPSVSVRRYWTPGVVVISSRSNSRSNRSEMISICSSPKKPQRKPKPSAALVSGSKVSEASFNCSFSSASFKSG